MTITWEMIQKMENQKRPDSQWIKTSIEDHEENYQIKQLDI